MNTNSHLPHNPQAEKNGPILRLPKVQSKVSLGKSSIYAGMKKGTFPKAYKLGERAIGWFESDITAWLESRKTSGQKEAA